MKIKTPFLRGSMKVYLNRELVATDRAQEGKLFGTATISGSEVAVTGTVDYTNGVASITFASAVTNGAELTVGFDVDIESDPSLIPEIDHAMEAFTLRPFQRVITAGATIMAMFAASTEINLNTRAQNLTSMRNTVVDEKAKNQMRDIYWAATASFSFDATVNAGDDWRVVYEQLNAELSKVSTHLVTETEVAGLSGLYAGKDWANFIKSLPRVMFEPARNYKQVPAIHYCGLLFGKYKVFEVPQADIVPVDEMVGYAKSDTVGKCGYLTGDVIPPTLYSHEVTKGLRKTDTLWALGYDEVHPRSGSKFYVNLKLNNYAMAA